VSILLDTHVLLWAAGLKARLSESAKTLLRDPDEPIFFSAASAWEIAIKWRKGRLDLPAAPEDIVKNVITRAGFSQLAINLRDACAVAELPFHHKDPFDRLLIVQARIHGLKLMTSDIVFERYDVDLIALWLDDDE
jgi:PIN domain nuclease of toxin-antitoxin system